MIKTHMLAPVQLKPGYRAIFLFGDIVAAVISTKLRRNDVVHFRNCGCGLHPSVADIYKKDHLNYEAMFDTWMASGKRYPVLAMRYETMYQHEKEISDYLGEPVKLLPWKDRKTDIHKLEADKVALIEYTYASLIAKEKAASDIQIIDGGING